MSWADYIAACERDGITALQRRDLEVQRPRPADSAYAAPMDNTLGPPDFCDYCDIEMTWDDELGWVDIADGAKTVCEKSPNGEHLATRDWIAP